MEESPSGPSNDSVGVPTIRSGYDWAQTAPRLAVLETVSDAEGVRPTDLPPLDACIDSDALNGLFERAPDGEGVRIEFWYAGREVTVESGGSVVVTPTQGVA